MRCRPPFHTSIHLGGGIMDSLLRGARRLARIGIWFGGSLVILAAFVITFDVLIRKLFDLSIGGASELAGYVLAISTAWSLALTLLDRAHIRIDTVYVLLPTRLCAVLDVLALLGFVVFAGFITVQGYGVLMQSVQLNSHSLTPLATPLVIPQFLWFTGLAFFLLVATLLFLRAAIALVTGDLETVRLLASSGTAVEELEQNIDAAQKFEKLGGA
jgi:TRAP-type C4-dicarboxylate transport system permease small subunit